MKPMLTRYSIFLPSGHRLYFFTLEGATAWLANERAEGRERETAVIKKLDSGVAQCATEGKLPE